MKQEVLNDYKHKVIQASSAELIVISYELIIDNINEAIKIIENHDKKLSKASIIKAQNVLKTLMESLDFNYDIAKDLLKIYLYINQQLIMTTMNYDMEILKNINTILANLLESWRIISISEAETPIIKNSEKLYAGLTYSKGQLNETVINNGSLRGIQV